MTPTPSEVLDAVGCALLIQGNHLEDEADVVKAEYRDQHILRAQIMWDLADVVATALNALEGTGGDQRGQAPLTRKQKGTTMKGNRSKTPTIEPGTISIIIVESGGCSMKQIREAVEHWDEHGGALELRVAARTWRTIEARMPQIVSRVRCIFKAHDAQATRSE